MKAAGKSRSTSEVELRSWPPFAPGEWRDGVLATLETTQGRGPVVATSGEDVSPVGCLHMGGNVSEWVVVRVPEGEEPSGVRGGNWNLTRAAADVRRVPTKRYERSFRETTIGFRCAVDGEVVRQ